MSFREYNGIDVCAHLPDGVSPVSLASFCAGLLDHYETLTQGFEVEWDNGNEVGRWYDEDGDRVTEGEPIFQNNIQNAAEALYYWQNDFKTEVSELTARTVYDLADEDNYSYVVEFLQSDFNLDSAETREDVAKIVTEAYENNADTIFVGATEFVDEYMDRRDDS